jgi:two-component system chemotaxis response regulator CheY
MFANSTGILVVDDMKTMRKIVSKSLRSMGFKKITEAEDGQKAWVLLNDPPFPIELVISDWNMPNSSGLDFLKRVRADDRFKNLPFMLLTAENEAEQVKEAAIAGVSNYMVKPFTPATLGEKLKAVYAKHNQAAVAA